MQEVGELGGFGAVMVDTSAAFFEGAEENDNVQLGNHARLLRRLRLTELPGEPGVIVGCHPTKNGELLLPRGVGSFVAEMDGNLTAKKLSDQVVELHWCGKYRGPGFEPVLFELETITSNRVKDAKGRLIPSVMVRVTDNAKADDIDTTPGMSQAKMAEALGWVSKFGPDKAKVNRVLTNFVRHKLAQKGRRGKYLPSELGKKDAAKLRKSP